MDDANDGAEAMSLLPKPPDQRKDRIFEGLRRERANVLVSDAAVLADNEGLRNAVDSPINADSAVAIGAGARVRVAQCVEPPRGVVGVVLVVETVNRNDTFGLKLHEHGMLLPARDAPRSKDIDQRHLADEIGAR